MSHESKSNKTNCTSHCETKHASAWSNFFRVRDTSFTHSWDCNFSRFLAFKTLSTFREWQSSAFIEAFTSLSFFTFSNALFTCTWKCHFCGVHALKIFSTFRVWLSSAFIKAFTGFSFLSWPKVEWFCCLANIVICEELLVLTKRDAFAHFELWKLLTLWTHLFAFSKREASAPLLTPLEAVSAWLSVLVTVAFLLGSNHCNKC